MELVHPDAFLPDPERKTKSTPSATQRAGRRTSGAKGRKSDPFADWKPTGQREAPS
jgi:prophage tail gpP-like protein